MRGDPHFLLYGILGLYNYGCEAIVRGTFRILREVWPDCRVTYASHQAQEDERRLGALDIRVANCRVPRLSWRHMSRAILRRLHLPTTAISPVSSGVLKGIDCVLSIGGDLYTLPPHKGTQEAYVSSHIFDFGEMVLNAGVPYVIWGASIGPFDRIPSSIGLFSSHFRKASLITVREGRTFEYLKSLGASANVRRVSDPAFLMCAEPHASPSASRTDSRPLVGVNLSPPSVWHASGNAGAKSFQARACETLQLLLDRLDVELLLVPHTVCPWNADDDDYRFLQGIERGLGTYSSRVRLLPRDLGARQTKAALAECTVVAAARMHCAIAALSSCVPTILISYSRKAVGMAEELYGNSDWVVAMDELCPALFLERVQLMLRQQDDVRVQLRRRIPVVEENARVGAEELAKLLPFGWGKGHRDSKRTETPSIRRNRDFVPS